MGLSKNAFFFTCVTFIYIGALSITIFVISSATISAIVASLIATRRKGQMHEKKNLVLPFVLFA
ncbi:hypothetical protein CIPAW_08G183000 [Carya illinoinensis]|uniref:Uncharacterized protein n=1 Tax=Carya illinoinensis TaxID=32201 RepID=A0A8T1Q125_CARIL|nr:hypothetical protein CIPAW_08G183000 [Carya illinoinensis]KAG6701693.1 hypothetical protein I3842_08G177800 [Carya illinoinensis]